MTPADEGRAAAAADDRRRRSCTYQIGDPSRALIETALRRYHADLYRTAHEAEALGCDGSTIEARGRVVNDLLCMFVAESGEEAGT